MSTAIASDGGYINGRQPTADDIVTVAGAEVRISDAERFGYVQRQSDGTYTDVPEEERLSLERSEEPQEEPEGDLEVAEETSDTLHDWLPAFEAELGKGAATQIMSQFLTDPSTLPEGAVEMARRNGVDPGAFLSQAQKVFADVGEAINSHIGRITGLTDFDGFWNWAQERHGQTAITSAGVQAIRVGDASPFIEWARQFSRSHNKGHSAHENETVKARVDGRMIEVDPASWETLKRNNPSVYHDGMILKR